MEEAKRDEQLDKHPIVEEVVRLVSRELERPTSERTHGEGSLNRAH